jgi:heme-degrading monooxygenase HmoA
MLAKTPSPPYYAVIFTSLLEKQHEGYSHMADKMLDLVSKQDGFLGFEAAREELGITVSYWRDLDSIKKWKNNNEHIVARQKGKSDWYKYFKVRIAKVEREYESG